MEAVDQVQKISPPLDVLPFARSYQIEALEKAIKQNTIVFLETGSGKTLIAVMLLRSYSQFIRHPSPYKAVFLVPTIVLVTQQAEVVRSFTDFKVGTYSGETKMNLWDANTWKEELDKHEVLVMTPQILLNALRHSFVSLGMIKVLIFDECHNALRDHPYAQIMKQFYHPLSHNSEVPRMFGMTASPVKAKGSSEATEYWTKIQKLENLMDCKVYTCDDQSILDGCISFPTVKLKFYEQSDPPFSEDVNQKLSELVMKHMCSLKKKSVKKSFENSVHKRLQSLAMTFDYCVNELGLWVALNAVESYSSRETANLYRSGKNVVDRFNLDVQKLFKSYFPSGCSIHNNTISEANTKAGLLSDKVASLQKFLLEYRDKRDLRCIVFVERVITAIALQSHLNEQLKDIEWETKYIAGNTNVLQSQSRQYQSRIIEEFREGKVNIIVATSILEEGLDVQSCNLVIRFDPSSNICSFIQSRGRARTKNSEFVLMLKRGDESALAQAKMHLASIEIMRSEILQNSSLPCEPSNLSLFDQMSYKVESTGAVVNLSGSVQLIHFYCSKLPSDGYFKPLPHFSIDKESKTCTLQLPNSCPVQSVTIKGSIDSQLKPIACLEACKKLHQMGALTDHLVPDIVEEANVDEQNNGEELYNVDQALYFPPELVSIGHHSESYHFYYLDLKTSFVSSVPVHNVILAFNTKLDLDVGSTLGKIEINQGCNMDVKMKYLGEGSFTKQQVILSRMFQVAVFRALVGHSFEKINKATEEVKMSSHSAQLDYLILPSNGSSSLPTVDWRCIKSVLFHHQSVSQIHENCTFSKDSSQIHTKNGLVCRCMLKSSLVYTPHNGHLYLVFGFLNHLNINSDMNTEEGKVVMTYKDYFKKRHGIDLHFDNEVLFGAKPIFRLQNFLQSCGQNKRKATEYTSHELPPEACYVIMSPIKPETFHTFSLVALIMHRIESMLIAASLQQMYADQCTQNVVTIPTMKILEAITTKKCQEAFHLESLETLGDSFLKYAVSQHLFKRHRNHHEGLLSLKRERIISNDALCKLGCKRKIPGFIRNQIFDPRYWCVPGDRNVVHLFEEEWVDADKRMYKIGKQKLKAKRVADVVEALIGAFLSSGGEVAALSFMNWLGIEVDSSYNISYTSQLQVDPTMYVDVNHLQSLLQYTFRDPSLLVEALTHGSYMNPEIPRCYQRLEFLGDSVLDHVVTLHLYSEHPGLSPGQLTEMRSASVNNDCYAYATIRVQLHKHILYDSNDLHKDFVNTIHSCQQLLPESIFGWQLDIHFPKVLADVIESLAGAIFVDSGYDKDVVFKSLRPLLEPLVTPETLKIHPFQELQLFCQKHHFVIRKPVVCKEEDGATSYKLEVEANGVVHIETHTTTDKKLAQKITSKAILKSLKDCYGC